MHQSMLRCTVSEIESKILEDIEEIGFGELYDLKLDRDFRPTLVMNVSPKTETFLKTLRRTGFAAKVIVHDGEPSILEYLDITRNGRPCLRRIKF